MSDWAVIVAIAIVLVSLAVAWIIHTVDKLRPWYAQRAWKQGQPTRKQIKAWKRERTITVVPQPNRRRSL